jgi:SAM-dependent methyltransferase
VIEVGAGSGLNFAHYPEEVEEVLAVEPEPYLRARAQKAADARVRVVEASADRLPAEDGEFDAGVASLVLCTVPDQAAALAELRRVLRPGGELRFYEHIRPDGVAGRIVRIINPVYGRLAGGCSLTRDTVPAIEAAGFSVLRVRRFDFQGLPHVIGRATVQ